MRTRLCIRMLINQLFLLQQGMPMQNNNPIEPTSKQTKMIEDAVALHQSGQLDLAEIQYKTTQLFA